MVHNSNKYLSVSGTISAAAGEDPEWADGWRY